MKIIVLRKEEIAGFIADRLEQELARKPDSRLGVITGSTPLTLGIYREWIQRAGDGRLDFSNVKFVNPDELLGLPEGHPETFRMYMKTHLFSALGIRNDQSLIPNGGAKNPGEECTRFERCLKDLGRVDFQLLGLGANGHIAFMEPADSISAKTYVVQLEPENCPRFMETGEERVINEAITIGLGTVMRAQSVLLIAAGEKKADIVAKAFLGPVTTRIPASFLQLHRNAVIVLDEAAASKIPDSFFSEGE